MLVETPENDLATPPTETGEIFCEKSTEENKNKVVILTEY